jgi:hypothetical protein
MGAFQSTKGIKNAIIGDETIAKLPLPDKDDSRWQPAGEVSQLYIYPVKSFCGKPVEKAKIEKHGLTNGPLVDRQFIGMIHEINILLLFMAEV